MAACRHGGTLPQGASPACKTSTNRHETPVQQETQLDEHKADESVNGTAPTRPSRHQDTDSVVETQENQYKATLADAEDNIRTLTEELDKANKSLQFLKHTSRSNSKKLEKIFGEKDSEIQLLATKCKNIEASERDAMNGVEQLKRENFELGKQLKKFAEELRRTQERSIRDMTDGRWVPPPDETVRDRLRRLDRDVRDWAKRWVGPPLRLDSLSSEVRRDFTDNYLCRVVPRINGRPPLSITSPKSRMEDRLSLLLLMAVLADEITECFFESPFFCFDEDSCQVLATTYQELTQASPREGHIWRSAMVRIMNPCPRRDQTPNEVEALKLSEHRVRRFCDRTSAKFTEGHSELLLKTLAGQTDAEAERAKSLANIMMSAASIAISLWAQRPYLRWHRIEQLELVPFDVKSPIMEPHPMHRIDEDDTSHNGRKIGIVIRPSLWAPSEDDLGLEDETKSRVLAKAVVWLED